MFSATLIYCQVPSRLRIPRKSISVSASHYLTRCLCKSPSNVDPSLELGPPAGGKFDGFCVLSSVRTSTTYDATPLTLFHSGRAEKGGKHRATWGNSARDHCRRDFHVRGDVWGPVASACQATVVVSWGARTSWPDGIHHAQLYNFCTSRGYM
jgi:hypothetical protein